MNEYSYHKLIEKHKSLVLEISQGNLGICIDVRSGLCGELYVFDQGDNERPRYICVKTPKINANVTTEECAKRFVNELDLQLSFARHKFVHWPFDFIEVMDVPVALFQYWGSDMKKLIINNTASLIERLSVMTYTCAGLRHCYNNGLIAHQDLNPANIFLRDIASEFSNLPNLNIYKIAIIADFGLSNAARNYGVSDGSMPYMAPEQWDETSLNASTDVFALGVILFELMTGGYHPIGIKLSDFWPVPIEGNSKKWMGERPWKQWVKNGCPIKSKDNNLSFELEQLVKNMLSISPNDRPSINSVIISLLAELKPLCQDSYQKVKEIIDDYDQKSCSEVLNVPCPYLTNKWIKLKEKYG